MASTGPAVYPSTTSFPGTGVYPGQGNLPLLLVQYATDAVSVVAPTWLDATGSVRAFSTTRGRNTELDEIDAGTASITLDNRTRTYDPVINSGIRPMNRWWIREQFTGETQDLFIGYAESYEQSWAGQPVDAVTTVSCSDEFKPLSLAALPTMSPPVATYADVVMNDNPNGYWHMHDPSASFVITAAVGDNFGAFGGGGVTSFSSGGAIIGDNPDPYLWMQMAASGAAYKTSGMAQGSSGDLSSLPEFAVEFWFQPNSVSAVTDDMLIGPNVTGPHVQWQFQILSGVITLTAWNGTSNFTVASSTLTAGQWYHIVGVADGTVLKMYVNGVLANSSAGTWTAIPSTWIASELTIGDLTLANSQGYNELAVYRQKLTAAQVLNHYQAGALRGAVRLQTADQRMNAVLDALPSTAPRSIRAGTRNMTGVFYTGQPPLTELVNARDAENVDSMLFISKGGTVTFLDAAHRASSPWNTVQSTWGDAGGSEIPYVDLTVDFSEQFLSNVWNVTADGGLVTTASDATSISKYLSRPTQLGVPVATDIQSAAIGTAMLAKYKDPFTRITGITALASVPAVSEALFRRDLGDCIRILRTPPGGGARIDQTSFIQKIAVSGTPSSPWAVTWTVSPL